MKKILSILLALSVACGSLVLTSCSDSEKDEDEDDDKSVSDDKDKDEDEDDSKSEEDESEDDSKSEEDESDSESESEDDSKSEEDDSDSESESEPDSGEILDESEYIDSFDNVTVEVFGTTDSWPCKAEPFCEFFGVDPEEMVEADDWDWITEDDAEFDYFNPNAEAVRLGDCYVSYVWVDDANTDFEFSINGIGVGSTVEDINDAFGTAFTTSNGEIEINDDVYYDNWIEFGIEGGEVVTIDAYGSESKFETGEGSESEGSESDAPVEGEIAAGDVVEFSGVSFVAPEGFTGTNDGDQIDFASTDELSFETINIQSSVADSIDNYSQSFFDDSYSSIYGDSFSTGTYETFKLGTADAFLYTCYIDISGITMELIQYCILMDDASVIVSIGTTDDTYADTIDAFIDSFEVL